MNRLFINNFFVVFCSFFTLSEIFAMEGYVQRTNTEKIKSFFQKNSWARVGVGSLLGLGAGFGSGRMPYLRQYSKILASGLGLIGGALGYYAKGELSSELEVVPKSNLGSSDHGHEKQTGKIIENVKIKINIFCDEVAQKIFIDQNDSLLGELKDKIEKFTTSQESDIKWTPFDCFILEAIVKYLKFKYPNIKETNGLNILKLQIYLCAREERFKAIVKSYFKDSTAVLYVERVANGAATEKRKSFGVNDLNNTNNDQGFVEYEIFGKKITDEEFNIDVDKLEYIQSSREEQKKELRKLQEKGKEIVALDFAFFTFPQNFSFDQITAAAEAAKNAVKN